MTEKLDNIRNETNTETKGVRELTDEEAAQIKAGYWDECETSGCEFFGHSHQCIDQRQRGLCPYWYTW